MQISGQRAGKQAQAVCRRKKQVEFQADVCSMYGICFGVDGGERFHIRQAGCSISGVAAY